MNSQSIDVKIDIYKQKLPDSENLGYQANIKTNVLSNTIVTKVYLSEFALYIEAIDPILKNFRKKALQNRRGFTTECTGMGAV